MTFFRLAMAGVRDGLRELKQHGKVQPKSLDWMLSREETYHLLGYTPSQSWTYPSANARGREDKRTAFTQQPTFEEKESSA